MGSHCFSWMGFVVALQCENDDSSCRGGDETSVSCVEFIIWLMVVGVHCRGGDQASLYLFGEVYYIVNGSTLCRGSDD
jgi:hypothetical protein